MMKGYLESKGIKVAESRVAESLQRVAPLQYDHRRDDTVGRLNPSPYFAMYFGHKLHIDHNEKLARYGVTHIVARDGFSGKIICYSTMPVKNNLAIYESIFRYTCAFKILSISHTVFFTYNAYSIQDISQYTWLMDSGQGGSWQRILSDFVCPGASQASIWSPGYYTICSITFNRYQFKVYRRSKSPTSAGALPLYSMHVLVAHTLFCTSMVT